MLAINKLLYLKAGVWALAQLVKKQAGLKPYLRKILLRIGFKITCAFVFTQDCDDEKNKTVIQVTQIDSFTLWQ